MKNPDTESCLAKNYATWVPQTANGAVACQLMDAVCLGNFPMQKVSGMLLGSGTVG